MYELSKEFRFEAAHTLVRKIDTESSRRIHGHSYRAKIVICGVPDPDNGMIMDLGLLAQTLEETRDGLDHRFLDDVSNLGAPTLENLSAWIWQRLKEKCPGLTKVTVYRDSEGDACSYFGLSTTSSAERKVR